MRNSLYLFLIAFCLLHACKNITPGKNQDENITGVKVCSPINCEYNIPVRTSGALATKKQMKLSFKTGGIISRINVREGEYVQEGQLLSKLDLSEIKARQQQTGIALEKAERDLERAGNLYRDSVATLEQLQDARSAVQMAKANKQIADFNYRHSFIRAPSSGRIEKILVEENEIVSVGYPVLLFATTGNAWIVRVALTDKDIVRLSVGDSAVITMDPYPERNFKAVISELGAVADPVTGTYQAELRLNDIEKGFRSGYISRAMIYPSDKHIALSLPVEAVQNLSDNRATVYRAVNGKAIKTDVKTGPVIEDRIIILDGIITSDIIIADGLSYLSAGSEINIVDTLNQTAQ